MARDEYLEPKRRARPCQDLPGSKERIAAMEERARLKQPLHVSGDRDTDDSAGVIIDNRGKPVGEKSLLSKTFDNLTFPRILDKHRRRLGLTVRELADAAGVSTQTLYYLLDGDSSPTLATLKALAAALKMTVSELLAGL